MTIITETERLILRVPTIDDASDSLEIYGDPEVMKFVDGSPPFDSIDRATRSLEAGIVYQQEHGIMLQLFRMERAQLFMLMELQAQ